MTGRESAADPDDLAKIRDALAKATPGPWKLWGMTVMTDRSGTGTVDYAETIANTIDPDRGLRTFNADLICLLRNNAEGLLDRLERAERERDQALADRPVSVPRMTWDEQTHPDDPKDFPETPALVTVEQAQSDLAFYDRFESLTTLQAGIQRYAHTVASEPERTRAAAVKALLRASERVCLPDRRILVKLADAIENGAPYA